MSTNSLGDTFVSTVKKTDKPGNSTPAPVIVAPPHFGDLGKAANDTFTKVISI